MSINEFRSIVQKGESENYLLDKYLFRHISVYGTFLASKTKIAPNTVTFISLIFSLAPIGLLLIADDWSQYLAAFCMFMYHYLDHVDGELARFRIRNGAAGSGIAGSYFDILCHSYSINLWLLSIGFGVAQQSGQTWIFLVSVVASAGVSTFARLVAHKTFVLKLSQNPDLLQTEPGRHALRVLNNRDKQVSEMQSPAFSVLRVRKMAKEMLGYPGIILLAIAAVSIDAATDSYLARTALIIATALLRAGFTPIVVVRVMRAFRAL